MFLYPSPLTQPDAYQQNPTEANGTGAPGRPSSLILPLAARSSLIAICGLLLTTADSRSPAEFAFVQVTLLLCGRSVEIHFQTGEDHLVQRSVCKLAIVSIGAHSQHSLGVHAISLPGCKMSENITGKAPFIAGWHGTHFDHGNSLLSKTTISGKFSFLPHPFFDDLRVFIPGKITYFHFTL